MNTLVLKDHFSIITFLAIAMLESIPETNFHFTNDRVGLRKINLLNVIQKIVLGSGLVLKCIVSHPTVHSVIPGFSKHSRQSLTYISKLSLCLVLHCRVFRDAQYWLFRNTWGPRKSINLCLCLFLA